MFSTQLFEKQISYCWRLLVLLWYMFHSITEIFRDWPHIYGWFPAYITLYAYQFLSMCRRLFSLEAMHKKFLNTDQISCPGIAGNILSELLSKSDILRSLCLRETQLLDDSLYKFSGASLEMLDVSETKVWSLSRTVKMFYCKIFLLEITVLPYGTCQRIWTNLDQRKMNNI